MPRKKKKEDPKVVQCRECGKDNMNGTYYCVGCGAPLVAAAPPEYDELLEDFHFEDDNINDSDVDDLIGFEDNNESDVGDTDDFDDMAEFETSDEEITDELDVDLDEEFDDDFLADEPIDEELINEEIDLSEIDDELDDSILGIEEELSEPDYEELAVKPVNPTIENTILSTESDNVVFSAPLLAIPNKDVRVSRDEIDFTGAVIGEKLVICAEGDSFRALIAPENEIACLVSARGTEAEVLKYDYMLRMCEPTLEEKINAYAYLEDNIETVHTIFGNKTLEDIYQDDVEMYINLRNATPAMIATNINHEVVGILSKLEAEKQDEIAKMITELEATTVSKATAIMIVNSDGDINEARHSIMQDIRITEMMSALLSEKDKPKPQRDFYRKCSIY